MLGCIADDFTGATDLANILVGGGMRVVQTIGVPDAPVGEDADAIVVALKSRTIPVDEAVSQSLSALAWLRETGATQIFFKYCSTFDSTPAGNIGPVTDALMDALDCPFTIACPAYPGNGRTVFNGYLFVGQGLLHESGMKDHPLTPMTDSNLVRVLQPQTRRNVGLVGHHDVAAGSDTIETAFRKLQEDSIGIAIVDAVSDRDLVEIGKACTGIDLVTGGSGVAIGLPANFGIDAKTPPTMAMLPAADGHAAIIAGSCSVATNGQVADFIESGGAAFQVDVSALDQPDRIVAEALEWSRARIEKGPVLIYTTSKADDVRATQQALGAARTGEIVEGVLSGIAAGLVEQGVGRLVVAGGETSGACVTALGIRQLVVGPEIAPGVPWCYAVTSAQRPEGLHLALKSGNFGQTDFFSRAFEMT